MSLIPFNIPYVAENTNTYLAKVFQSAKFCGDGPLTKECNTFLEKFCQSGKVLLTTSCTHALEMTALLSDIHPADEVIMASYTFVSTANAFVLRGAKIVFVDIDPKTMNIDGNLIKAAITSRTKAIVVMHYGGIACDMDVIMGIATQHDLIVIEDAAQGLDAYYNDRPLGSIGAFGTLSFHETKNIHCGEGGALMINDPKFIERAEIVREKGTDRSKFIRGMVDKYSWVDMGSSYLPSELNAAFLMAQLSIIDHITSIRIELWNRYNSCLKPLQSAGKIVLPFIPEGCRHNAHLFYLKCRDIEERTALIEHLKAKGIQTVFHYIPLHSSPFGLKHSEFFGADNFTTLESEKLLRLPLYNDLSADQVNLVCKCIFEFYE